MTLVLACTMPMENVVAPCHGLRSWTGKKEVSTQLPDCKHNITSSQLPNFLEPLMFRLPHGRAMMDCVLKL